MPNRYIRESSRSSPSLARLSDQAERLWWRIITCVDDFGRMEADPEVVLAEAFKRKPKGWTVRTVERAITELANIPGPEEKALILLYMVRGRFYLQLITATAYIHQRAPKSKFPDPREGEVRLSLGDPSSGLHLAAGAGKCASYPNSELRTPNIESEKGVLEADARFAEFWQTYPARDGKKLDKAETKRRFLRLSPEDQVLAVHAARNYAASLKVSGIAAKDPKRFLLDGQGNAPWQDWTTPASPAPTGTRATCDRSVQRDGDRFIRRCGNPVPAEELPNPKPLCVLCRSEVTRLRHQTTSVEATS